MRQSARGRQAVEGIKFVSVAVVCLAVLTVVSWFVLLLVDLTRFSLVVHNRSSKEAVTNLVAVYSAEGHHNELRIALKDIPPGGSVTYGGDGREPNLRLEYTRGGKARSFDTGYVIPGVQVVVTIEPNGSAHQLLDE